MIIFFLKQEERELENSKKNAEHFLQRMYTKEQFML